MNADEKDLLHRHLNGDLDASEQAAFFARLQESAELRRELASHAFDESLLSEIILEKRTVAQPKRRAWLPAAGIAAAMVIALTLVLTLGRSHSPLFRVARVEGSATILHANDDESPVQPGAFLREGDQICALKGVVVLETEHASVELGSESAVSLRQGELVVDRGMVGVAAGGGAPLRLGSTHGTTIVHEASASLEIRKGRLRVEVEKGSVDVERSSVVRIDAGRYALIGADVETGRLVPRVPLDDAVKRACAFLESRRNDIVAPMVSEKRNAPPPRRTYAELALLALHRGGYPDSHPVKAELLGLVRGRSVESTYIAALQAIALAEIDPAAHQDRIRLCAQLLVDSQCANGQWDYAVKSLPNVPATGRIRRRQEGPASGDNSVTAYAVLGLHAAARAGVDLDPTVLERSRAWWVTCQNKDGGWGYNEAGSLGQDAPDKSEYTTNTSYGSMTASAVAALAAIRELRGGEGDVALRRGIEWIGANFAADHNPRKTPGFLPLHWLSMASRGGQLLAVEHFGSHEWYAEGADFLLASQRPGGEWTAEQGEFMKAERMDVLDTCLAILFLRRESR
ncbi:MAG TPA: prenyltransferase/squalene oxidase repeat-containing protein [Planctomycetota bacterium]|nr:prenyltransferase/squalene oxidase repeat-containing protein [Planctomycetota bacterium]